MLKFIGSLCVLGGGVLVRYFQAAERRREMDTLSGLLSALRRMAEEIRMARLPLPQLFDRITAGCNADVKAFFSAAAAAARQGEQLEDTWRKAAAALPLSNASRTALGELGSSFHGDEENICKGISVVIYTLAKEAEERTRRQPEEAKRATALCLSAAALLVILLI